MAGASAVTPVLDDLDLFVWEGATDIAARAAAQLAGCEVDVHRLDVRRLPVREPGMRPAVALVSVSAVSGRVGDLQTWLTDQALPVIWVAAHTREPLPGYFAQDYQSILPAEFSGVELRAMLGLVAGELRTRQVAAAGPTQAAPLVAQAPVMRALLDEVTAYADCDATVLVYGPTGAGKERIARQLHDGNSRYGRGPFVPVNCGAIPDGLFESHFFGHARGAFTGAVGAHKGYFEQADGGTLFLDEIGELPLHQQVKLLRVLETSEVTRLGASTAVQVDFRLVGATHRRLPDLVARGDFRADLYYRLAVVELEVPSLDERGAADKAALFLALLAQHLPAQMDAPPDTLVEEVSKLSFPGNVRELGNLVARLALIRTQFKQWDATRLAQVLARHRAGQMAAPSAAAPVAGPVSSLRSERDARERERILAALAENDWRRQDTAASLGISRKVLWEKMRRLAIEGPPSGGNLTEPGVFS